MGVFNVVGVLLALDVVRDELHRSWTIERNECDDLVDGRDIKLAAERLHAAGFELEDADRLGVVEQGEGLGILEANFLDIKLRQFAVLPHELLGVIYYGERLQSQEVHLE